MVYTFPFCKRRFFHFVLHAKIFKFHAVPSIHFVACDFSVISKKSLPKFNVMKFFIYGMLDIIFLAGWGFFLFF